MAETAMVSAQKLAAVVVAREDPLDQGAVEAAVSWVDATPAVEGGAAPIPWGQYTSEGYFLHTHRGLARWVCILLVLPHTDSYTQHQELVYSQSGQAARTGQASVNSTGA